MPHPAIGALYTPLHAEDVLAVLGYGLYVWLASVAWDAATDMWRPDSGPATEQLLANIKATRAGRWVFAVIAGLAVPAAFLSARVLGLEHPNWTFLAIVVALAAMGGCRR